jgi:hypothetical protein
MTGQKQAFKKEYVSQNCSIKNTEDLPVFSKLYTAAKFNQAMYFWQTNSVSLYSCKTIFLSSGRLQLRKKRVDETELCWTVLTPIGYCK